MTTANHYCNQTHAPLITHARHRVHLELAPGGCTSLKVFLDSRLYISSFPSYIRLNLSFSLASSEHYLSGRKTPTRFPSCNRRGRDGRSGARYFFSRFLYWEIGQWGRSGGIKAEKAVLRLILTYYRTQLFL